MANKAAKDTPERTIDDPDYLDAGQEYVAHVEGANADPAPTADEEEAG